MTSSAKLLFGSSIPICSYNQTSISLHIIITSILAGITFLALLFRIGYWFIKEDKWNDIKFQINEFYYDFEESLDSFKDWIKVKCCCFRKEKISKPVDKKTDDIIPLYWQEILINFIVVIITIVYSVLWWLNNPFSIFESSSMEALGFSNQDEDISEINNFFNTWSNAYMIIFSIFSLIILIIFLTRFCVKFPEKVNSWKTIFLVTLTIFLFCNYIVFMIPPFTQQFLTIISTSASNNNIGIQNMIETLLGYALCGTIFSYLSNFYLFLLHGMPFGIYIGSIFFVLYHIKEGLYKATLTLILVINCILILTYPVTSVLAGKLLNNFLI